MATYRIVSCSRNICSDNTVPNHPIHLNRFPEASSDSAIRTKRIHSPPKGGRVECFARRFLPSDSSNRAKRIYSPTKEAWWSDALCASFGGSVRDEWISKSAQTVTARESLHTWVMRPASASSVRIANTSVQSPLNSRVSMPWLPSYKRAGMPKKARKLLKNQRKSPKIKIDHHSPTPQHQLSIPTVQPIKSPIQSASPEQSNPRPIPRGDSVGALVHPDEVVAELRLDRFRDRVQWL